MSIHCECINSQIFDSIIVTRHSKAVYGAASRRIRISDDFIVVTCDNCVCNVSTDFNLVIMSIDNEVFFGFPHLYLHVVLGNDDRCIVSLAGIPVR